MKLPRAEAEKMWSRIKSELLGRKRLFSYEDLDDDIADELDDAVHGIIRGLVEIADEPERESPELTADELAVLPAFPTPEMRRWDAEEVKRFARKMAASKAIADEPEPWTCEVCGRTHPSKHGCCTIPMHKPEPAPTHHVQFLGDQIISVIVKEKDQEIARLRAAAQAVVDEYNGSWKRGEPPHPAPWDRLVDALAAELEGGGE